MGDRVVTVFGGTGFLGREVVRALVAAGERVRVAARHPRALTLPGLDDRVERIAVDVRNQADLTSALAGARAAVNAVSLYVEDRETTFDSIHVRAAGALASAARAAGVECLVHISGIGADPGSRSRYVAARGAGERAVREGFPDAVLLRPSVLYGPGGAFLSTLDALTRLPVIPLFGDGNTRLQPVHAAEVARAVAAAIHDRQAQGQTFELGGAEVLSYREILSRVMTHRGRRRPMLPVPFAAWFALAGAAALLPSPPLTRDQIILMQSDNVAAPDAPGLSSLGIEPRALTAELAGCLP